jgi:hypothetical protein
MDKIKVRILVIDRRFNEHIEKPYRDIFPKYEKRFDFVVKEDKKKMELGFFDYSIKGILEGLFTTPATFFSPLYHLELHIDDRTFYEKLLTKFEVIEKSNLTIIEATEGTEESLKDETNIKK